MQFQQRSARSLRLTGEDDASSSDESKGACSLSFMSAIHSLPSSTGASFDVFSETSQQSLGVGSNIELTKRSALELRNSSGNNNSAAINSTKQLPASEMCNSNDLRLPSDIPIRISMDSQGVCDVTETVGDAGDHRGISDTIDGVNKLDNHQGMSGNVSRDEADDSSNVCQITGNESAEVTEYPDISVTDDAGRLGDVSTVSGSEVKTEYSGPESNSQMYNVFASVLVVSHGGLLMELLAYFIKELKCKLSESQRARFRIIPNAGVSKFVVQIGDGTKAFPKVICLSVFETDHLVAGNEDVAPLVSSADLI